MSSAVSVVISAAGLGTRLGLNLPKVLVEVAGKTLLQHHFDLLSEFQDIILVVGYRGQDVIDAARALRPDVTIAFNHEFARTGTAYSVSLASRASNDWLISLDGDLLVRKQDFLSFAQHPSACLGLIPVTSKTPVYATVDAYGQVSKLSQESFCGREWSGLAKVPRHVALNLGREHVFRGLTQYLPMDWRWVDSCEIDEPEDLDFAKEWLSRV
jgi:choline kinase